MGGVGGGHREVLVLEEVLADHHTAQEGEAGSERDPMLNKRMIINGCYCAIYLTCIEYIQP